MKILFLSYIPSPYRVDFFNTLGQMCDLTVIFEKAVDRERDDSWKQFAFKHFCGIVLEGKSEKLPRRSVTKYLKKGEYDEIVVHNPTTPTGIWAISYMKRKHIPYSVESDGALPKEGKDLTAPIKRYLFQSAKRCFSTAALNDQYFLKYGVGSDALVRYPFSSSMKKDLLPSVPTEEEKLALRQKLNMKESNVFLFVGQMIPRKGVDVLLRACQGLSEHIGIYIVGGKPTEEYQALLSDCGAQVHFVDFMLKPQLKEYYKAADCFVLPTREDIWGLVVNEAMACGLPVITTDRCVAGAELIQDGENGYLISTEDPDALRERMERLARDEELCRVMAQRSLETIQGYTIEKMAERHMDIWQSERGGL